MKFRGVFLQCKKTMGLKASMVFVTPMLIALGLSASYWSNNITVLGTANFSVAFLPVLPIPVVVSTVCLLLPLQTERRLTISAIAVVTIFCYGHVYALVDRLDYYPLTRNSLLVLLVLGAIAVSIQWVFRIDRLRAFNRFVLTGAVFLLAMNLLSIARHAVQARQALEPRPSRLVAESSASASTGHQGKRKQPDIYFLVFDAYTRGDVLRNKFGFDNEPFLSELRQREFYVADNSHSNYCQTVLSLAATLNCDYVDKVLEDDFGELEKDNVQSVRALANAIHDNFVFRALKQSGYHTVSIDASGYSPVLIRNADSFIEAPPQVVSQVLLKTTAVFPLYRKAFAPHWSHDYHRERTLAAGERVKSIASEAKQPIFAYAHFLLPHQPFLFGPEGQEVRNGQHFELFGNYEYGEQQYVDGYVNQLRFTNQCILEIVDRIMEASEEPPIIIIQGDHGSAFELDMESSERTDVVERMAILNAVFAPADIRDSLYPEMTSVNTFRLILSNVTELNLAPLDDRSYFSVWSNKLAFEDVGDRLHEPAWIRAD